MIYEYPNLSSNHCKRESFTRVFWVDGNNSNNFAELKLIAFITTRSDRELRHISQRMSGKKTF